LLNRMLNRNFVNYQVGFPDLNSLYDSLYDPAFFDRIKYYLKVSGSRHPALQSQTVSSILKYKLLQIITAPFIYLCFVPTLAMDLIVTLYQRVCFPLYGIPVVTRGDYVIIDRHKLKYLNLAKRINCVYCGYFSGVIAYVQEVAGRTEQYWCPVKHAAKL
jgi:hypothetical protein